MRRFETSDYHEIAGWYRARQLPVPEPADLPVLGLIEPEVAAAFLYRTDSSVALIEGAITNPEAPIRARSAAMARIAEELTEEAHRGRFRRVIVITRTGGIRRLARRLDFQDVGKFCMMGKSI